MLLDTTIGLIADPTQQGEAISDSDSDSEGSDRDPDCHPILEPTLNVEDPCWRLLTSWMIASELLIVQKLFNYFGNSFCLIIDPSITHPSLTLEVIHLLKLRCSL